MKIATINAGAEVLPSPSQYFLNETVYEFISMAATSTTDFVI
jgi:hypothetical protein